MTKILSSTTPGMANIYNIHSELQAFMTAKTMPILIEALQKMTLPSEQFGISDYGCSHGKNSIASVKKIIETIRERHPNKSMMVVHNDLPSNDFNQLWSQLYDQNNLENYLMLKDGPIYPLCSAASFYQQILPDHSVHCGISDFAAHWLSHLPKINCPETILSHEAQGESREALLDVAASDWNNFLTARAAEIASGGYLFVKMSGRQENNPCHSTVAAILALLGNICEEFIDSGLLKQETYNRFVFPVQSRTVEEATAPLKQSPLYDAWDCEYAAVDSITNLYYLDYLNHRNVEKYATEYTEFTRAFSEASFKHLLFEPGACQMTAEELTSHVFEQLHKKIATHPDIIPKETEYLVMLLRRK